MFRDLKLEGKVKIVVVKREERYNGWAQFGTGRTMIDKTYREGAYIN